MSLKNFNKFIPRLNNISPLMSVFVILIALLSLAPYLTAVGGGGKRPPS